MFNTKYIFVPVSLPKARSSLRVTHHPLRTAKMSVIRPFSGTSPFNFVSLPSDLVQLLYLAQNFGLEVLEILVHVADEFRDASTQNANSQQACIGTIINRYSSDGNTTLEKQTAYMSGGLNSDRAIIG